MDSKTSQEEQTQLQRESLIQYEQPIEVEGTGSGNNASSVKAGGKNSLEQRPSVEDILNTILSPREWTENQKKLV